MNGGADNAAAARERPLEELVQRPLMRRAHREEGDGGVAHVEAHSGHYPVRPCVFFSFLGVFSKFLVFVLGWGGGMSGAVGGLVACRAGLGSPDSLVGRRVLRS